MSESFLKKEKAKLKAKQKQEKAAKMKERKANQQKGKSLEDMMVYVDEFGNLCDTPPEKDPNAEIKLEDIQIGVAPLEDVIHVYQGTINFFNEEKGFGFITEDSSRESVFVHSNQLQEVVKERDRVEYEKERTPKGYSAIRVKKI
ncbi:MAG: cold shock domain-containing protein [Chitinophagaceae bacterium]|nr:cold shock domain-containing protein [Chitinophagaceae bacterium]